MRAPDGVRPGWLGYIGVDDVDAAVAGITAAGGSLQMPARDLANMGRIAMVADPQGAPFYVMRGAIDQPSTCFDADAIGHCAWNELATRDLDAAVEFYAGQFGWQRGELLPMGEPGGYQLMLLGDKPFGAMMARTGDMPPMWNFYFRVAAIGPAARACATAAAPSCTGRRRCRAATRSSSAPIRRARSSPWSASPAERRRAGLQRGHLQRGHPARPDGQRASMAPAPSAPPCVVPAMPWQPPQFPQPIRTIADIDDAALTDPARWYQRRLAAERDGGEPELGLLPLLIPARATALDVGANLGVFAFAMSQWAARVEAFEPHPELAFSRNACWRVAPGSTRWLSRTSRGARASACPTPMPARCCISPATSVHRTRNTGSTTNTMSRW